MFFPAALTFTVAVIVNVAVAPAANAPTDQTPVLERYVPGLGLAETNVTPVGNLSVTITPVAEFEPALFTLTV